MQPQYFDAYVMLCSHQYAISDILYAAVYDITAWCSHTINAIARL